MGKPPFSSLGKWGEMDRLTHWKLTHITIDRRKYRSHGNDCQTSP